MSRFLIFVWLLAALWHGQEATPAKRISFYSLESEIAFGRQLAAEFQRETQALESSPALAYINRIGALLTAQIAVRRSPAALLWSPAILLSCTKWQPFQATSFSSPHRSFWL
jgi:hypothetical protein